MAEKTKKSVKKEVKKKVKKEKAAEVKVNPRLAENIKNEIAPALMKQFSYKSTMEVPKLEKIVVNMGVRSCSSRF